MCACVIIFFGNLSPDSSARLTWGGPKRHRSGEGWSVRPRPTKEGHTLMCVQNQERAGNRRGAGPLSGAPGPCVRVVLLLLGPAEPCSLKALMAFSQRRESSAQVAQSSRKWSSKVSRAVLETGGAGMVRDLREGAELQMFAQHLPRPGVTRAPRSSCSLANEANEANP